MDVTIGPYYTMYYDESTVMTPLQFRGDVVVVVDPGKTNMAMVIGDPTGKILSILQFSAKGRANDTSTYCRQFKKFLKEYLANCTVYSAGIEAAVSYRGMNHHHSSMVLTEIRSHLIDLFTDLTGQKPEEINNWSWKSAILPQGMRSQSEKGSTRFLADYYRLYGTSDVTDAICMYMYKVRAFVGKYQLKCNRKEEALVPYKVSIVPEAVARSPQIRGFTYNTEVSLETNAAYIANRSLQPCASLVPIEHITLEEIYKYTSGSFQMGNHQVVGVVVVRQSNFS